MREHEFRCDRHREPVTKTLAVRFGQDVPTPPCPECGAPMTRVYHAVPMWANWKRGR